MNKDVVSEYLNDLDVNILVTQEEYNKEIHTKVLNDLYISGKTSKKLSNEHRLCLIHLNNFGSDRYKEVLDMIASNLYFLLKLNTIPIILHQEKKENVKTYQENSLIPQAKNLLFIKVDDQLLKELEFLAFIKKVHGMINGVQGILKKEKEELVSQYIFGLIFVEDEKITHKVLFEPGTV